jgi:hypothetical protein
VVVTGLDKVVPAGTIKCSESADRDEFVESAFSFDRRNDFYFDSFT